MEVPSRMYWGTCTCARDCPRHGHKYSSRLRPDAILLAQARRVLLRQVLQQGIEGIQLPGERQPALGQQTARCRQGFQKGCGVPRTKTPTAFNAFFRFTSPQSFSNVLRCADEQCP